MSNCLVLTKQPGHYRSLPDTAHPSGPHGPSLAAAPGPLPMTGAPWRLPAIQRMPVSLTGNAGGGGGGGGQPTQSWALGPVPSRGKGIYTGGLPSFPESGNRSAWLQESHKHSNLEGGGTRGSEASQFCLNAETPSRKSHRAQPVIIP